MITNYDLYDHLCNDLGIPSDWASRMSTRVGSQTKPFTFPYVDAADAVTAFAVWGSTPEGMLYWDTVYCGACEGGVQFLYDNPIDEFVPF